MRAYISIAFLMLALNGCGQTQNSGNKILNSKNNICSAAQNPNNYLDSILLHPKIYVSGSDSCIYLLLDTLTFLANNDVKYISSLDSLRGVSDGDISEYFLDVGIMLFYKSFKNLSYYIYRQKNKDRTSIEKLLIEALSMEVSDATDQKKKREQIRNFITKQSNIEKLPKEISTYMLTIEQKLNPAMYD